MSTNPFHGDRPIETDEQDRFGFGALATRIAEALTAQAAGKGFVMGVEGRWGCGKSSLLALTIARLRRMDARKVALVEFRPWLIGDRDQLLTGLFDDFAKAIAGLELEGGDATGVAVAEAKNVAEQARRFARHLGPLGKLVGLAGTVVPGGGIAGKVMEAIAAAAREVEDGPTLADQKAALSQALVKLDCRIVVVIDDVDRLDPKEVAELLRLVRSVADFPNVSYLLCYDAIALAHAIETATGVHDGSAYLEKIVQTEIAVPRPESFALRRWFSAELQTFAPCGEERARDLVNMISATGGRSFDTARTVVRTLDGLRAYWPGLQGKVDIVDLAWIRIVAVASPALYRWIEEYLTDYAALASGRVHIGQAERKSMGERLDAALAEDGLEWDQMRSELEEYLPGISRRNFDRDKEERLFSRSHQRSAGDDFERGRLASPSHGRLYFTLAEPSDSVSNMDVAELVQAAHKGTNDVASLLLHLSDQVGDAGSSKAERLLDQLLQMEDVVVTAWPVEQIVLGFVNVADALANDDRGDDWGYPRIWTIAADLLKRLSESLSPHRWETLVRLIFSDGQSLGFVSHLLRNETFAQGYFGNRSNTSERLTTPEIFNEIRETMLERYRKGGLEQLLGKRHSITMLYAWSQAGGRDELVRLIEARAVDDVQFLAVMRAICSTSTGTGGISFSLTLEAIHSFFEDPPAAARRVIRLAGSEPPLADAEFVLNAIRRSTHFHHSANVEEVVEAWEQRLNSAGAVSGEDDQ